MDFPQHHCSSILQVIMPVGSEKKDRRRLQNRLAQRAYRKRKKEQEARMNPEPFITPRESAGTAKQQSNEYSEEATDPTLIISPILSSDPAQSCSPDFTASSLEIHSSQRELKSPQIQMQDHPTMAAEAEPNHEMQDFLQATVPNISRNGSPNSLVYEKPPGNSLMQQPDDLFNPNWVQGGISPSQSGSLYDFQVAEHPPSTLPAPRQSNDPLLRIMSRMITSKQEVRLADIRLQEEKNNLSVEESGFLVDVEQFNLECAKLE